MTTSDPVLYPIPQTQAESIRQDAARARLDLAETIEALAARLNVRRQIVRKISSAGRRTAPAWAVGAGAASVAIVAGLVRPGARITDRLPWAAGGVAAVTGAVAYVAVDRRTGPNRQSRRGRRAEVIASASPAVVTAAAPRRPDVLATRWA
ncbi:MAG TPA: DUF3618 domain-containing protein, partial [Micromonosporaceae bacterium]|nr:DUF3618 domain-containing protein [Micromonosporaceae bacterium]